MVGSNIIWITTLDFKATLAVEAQEGGQRTLIAVEDKCIVDQVIDTLAWCILGKGQWNVSDRGIGLYLVNDRISWRTDRVQLQVRYFTVGYKSCEWLTILYLVV